MNGLILEQHVLLFAQRPAGAALHENRGNRYSLGLFLVRFELRNGEPGELAPDFDHVDTDAGQIRAAGMPELVFEADKADVFGHVSTMLPEPFAIMCRPKARQQ